MPCSCQRTVSSSVFGGATNWPPDAIRLETRRNDAALAPSGLFAFQFRSQICQPTQFTSPREQSDWGFGCLIWSIIHANKQFAT
jgi:hypothetical protein